jgi:hypothetical protein
MSLCMICGAKDLSRPREWERECTACLNDHIKGIDGTLTPTEKKAQRRRRTKWTG